MFIVGLLRLFFIVVKKDRKRLFYDSLLFSGMVYTFSYIVLKLNGGYYFMPSIILFLPSIVYWIKYIYEKKLFFLLYFFTLIGLSTIYINNFIDAVKNVKNTWQERQIFMPYISNLLNEYNDGKDFIWYESDNVITDNTFYIAVRGWRKHILNTFLNFKNKSEGKEYFITKKDNDYLDLGQEVYFFYPVDNDQNQPMQDSLEKLLKDNNFYLYNNSYGVLIYRRFKSPSPAKNTRQGWHRL